MTSPSPFTARRALHQSRVDGCAETASLHRIVAVGRCMDPGRGPDGFIEAASGSLDAVPYMPAGSMKALLWGHGVAAYVQREGV